MVKKLAAFAGLAIFAIVGFSAPASSNVYNGGVLSDGFAFNSLAFTNGTYANGQAINDTFNFTYLFPPSLSGFATTTNNVNPPGGGVFNISNLNFLWTNGADVAQNFGVATGQALALTADGIYSLIVTGTATGSQGGTYNATLFTIGRERGPDDVPLPSAIVLFGTALVGLGLFGRRRKAHAV